MPELTHVEPVVEAVVSELTSGEWSDDVSDEAVQRFAAEYFAHRFPTSRVGARLAKIAERLAAEASDRD